ncbi:DNA oxidative demethylase [Actinidia chinensis var. chinensis]|uniref:DNA oxidative demethylase n=1 Tax=Actinidia chinensis var. chinensis TaxID=1590841 RepID=A0A2R6QYE5_ACTCC|nr:DNA oxidative demethylase [Actinidia chinensis var. chinensis]
MERSTPGRKPHTSTADLLTWSENPPADSPSEAARSAPRSHQPSDGIRKVVFGGQVTDEEVESLNKRKPCSGYKLKEITGSGIFAADEENRTLESDANPTPGSKTGLRMYQQAVAGISHISFGDEGAVSPKKPATLPEVAKQRELCGTLESESEAKLKKQLSDAKSKELSGHNIFAPPPEIQPRPLAARALALRESIEIGEPAPVNVHTSVKVSKPAGSQSSDMFNEEPVIKTAKKIPNQKFAELTGNDIFRGDDHPTSAERSLSSAKLREISGNDIFADGKVESRDYFGGVRKPPGGSSSIALV